MCRRCYHGILIIMTMCELNLLFLVCILCERKKKMKVSNVSVVAICGIGRTLRTSGIGSFICGTKSYVKGH